MKLQMPNRFQAIGCMLLLLSSGCGVFLRPSWPLLYEPSCDLQPVLELELPKHIETLAACPRDETIVENGINQNSGNRQPDDIKEKFRLTKDRSDYEFIVFFSESAAVRRYESKTLGRFEKKYYPIFKETSVDGRVACVHYTQQPRADPEGGSVPLDS